MHLIVPAIVPGNTHAHGAILDELMRREGADWTDTGDDVVWRWRHPIWEDVSSSGWSSATRWPPRGPTGRTWDTAGSASDALGTSIDAKAGTHRDDSDTLWLDGRATRQRWPREGRARGRAGGLRRLTLVLRVGQTRHATADDPFRHR